MIKRAHSQGSWPPPPGKAACAPLGAAPGRGSAECLLDMERRTQGGMALVLMLWEVKSEQSGNSTVNTSACWLQRLEPLG